MPNPFAAEIRKHLDSLVAQGSLGRLRELALRLCEVQGTLRPVTSPRRVVLFAGPAATNAAIHHLLDGGAVCVSLAEAAKVDLVLVDVASAAGVWPDSPRYRSRKVVDGGRTSPLTTDEFWATYRIGQQEAERAAEDGIKVVAAGDLGASGTDALVGLLSTASFLADDPVEAIAAVCGPDIAAAAGFIARSAELGLTVLLDGPASDAAKLVAMKMNSGTADKLIDGGERFAEGVGALLALPMLDAAAAFVSNSTPLSELLPVRVKRKRIAVFGSTFDPPTTFHRHVAELIRAKGFDEVIVRPTGPRCEDRDDEHAAPLHRAVMADLAFRDIPGVDVDLGDLEAREFRDDFQLDSLYAEQGDVWHVISAESVKGGRDGNSDIQKRWKNGEEFWRTRRFVALHTSASPPDPADLPPFCELIAADGHVPTKTIRQRIFDGGDAAPDVPDAVDEYVRRYRLFSGIPTSRETRLRLSGPRLLIVVDEYSERARGWATRFREFESDKPNAVLVLGGDGTMLSAIRKHWRQRIPFLGLNAGTLGFLMNQSLPDDLTKTELLVYRMPMLQVDTVAPDGRKSRGLAFGDTWVERDGGQAAWLRVDVNGKTQVDKVMADGLLIATPAGSSAYAKAMGATPVPLTAPVLTLAGSNVFLPSFWKPVAMRESTVVRFTNVGLPRRPVRAFIDGQSVGQVIELEASVSPIAAVEIAFTPEFDLSERQLRTMFPTEKLPERK